MLIQYSVSNYKSIRDEVVLSFVSNDLLESHPNNVTAISEIEQNVLKSLALIGPNGAGKTNILESLKFCFDFIGGTAQRKQGETIGVMPFLLDTSSREAPSSFEFIYLWEGVRYVYGFSASPQAVEEEYLISCCDPEPVTVFERDRNNNYRFGGKDAELPDKSLPLPLKNQLFLPLAAIEGKEPYKSALGWFEATGGFTLTAPSMDVIENYLSDKEKRKELLRLLRTADFNISDLRLRGDAAATRKGVESIQIGILGTVVIEHEGTDPTGGKHVFSIDFDSDSAGTREFIMDAVAFLRMCDSGGLVGIDEFGTSLHQKLNTHLLSYFISVAHHKGKGQLLFTTHNTALLHHLRSDQIYLVDRDSTSGATTAQCFDDFAHRKDENFEQGYLKGRFGAVPYPKEDSEW